MAYLLGEASDSAWDILYSLGIGTKFILAFSASAASTWENSA